ncbi:MULTISPECIES: Na(+)/H(+) antiporter subunit C [Kytococcus]|uniref:Na(+)/H(+) antiporter subunit C n=1 Tax=Kytococcus TaxID=57499 RepID=UPI0008A58B0F|nr:MULTISPECIES: Na(+)/H(+) antiporter subunit C [Kytococcus]OFS06263.1 Na+/H+ antiporter subunit C [Kytococcus sp. HMSC28H12]
MTPSLTLCLLVGVLSACGVYLFLSRSLVRMLFGMLLLGNGVNLLFLVASGDPGRAPISDAAGTGPLSDPLPQAMVLTAIVISLAMTGFVMALAHRSWQVAHTDVVQTDAESRRISRRAEANSYTPEVFGEGSSDSADDPAAEGDDPPDAPPADETTHPEEAR